VGEISDAPARRLSAPYEEPAVLLIDITMAQISDRNATFSSTCCGRTATRWAAVRPVEIRRSDPGRRHQLWLAARALSAHMLVSQRLWLSRFLGNPMGSLPRLRRVSGPPDVDQPAGKSRLPHIEAFLAGLSDDQLAAPLTWASLPDGAIHTLPLWQR